MRKAPLVLVALAVMTTQVFAQQIHYTGPQCMSDCPGDIGPKADTAAVRAAMLKEMHTPNFMLAHMDVTHVYGDYAVIAEYSPGGAFAFKRVSDEHWKMIIDGGVISMSALLSAGVPTSIAKELCLPNWPATSAIVAPC